MKVKITAVEFAYSPNGIKVITYKAGDVIEVTEKLASELVAEGVAELTKVIETPKEVKLEKKVVKSKKK
jgi:hypothetical protein